MTAPISSGRAARRRERRRADFLQELPARTGCQNRRRCPATSPRSPGARAAEAAIIRRLAFTFLCPALLLGAARLLADVIHASDAPVADLVLKQAPATWMRRPEAEGRPAGQQIVLDLEEPELACGWLYDPLMGAVPILAPVMAGLATVPLFVSRTCPSRRRG